MAGLNSSARIETGVGLKLDPRLLLQSRLLQLSQHELEQAIELELSENPALDRLMDETQELTDEIILKSVAPQELRHRPEDNEANRSLPSDSQGHDWADMASALPSLHDHLRAQLMSVLPTEESDLADYVIGSLNDNGFLESAIEEIALETGREIEDVEVVVNALRACEPAGIGAFDVVDCLLLQLRDNETIEGQLAKHILRKHMDDFLARRTHRISRRFKVMPEVVEDAFSEILGLNPFPVEGFDNGPTLNSRASVALVPDLVFKREESGWMIEVRGPDPACLTLDRTYKRRFTELNKMTRAPQDEKRHVGHQVRRAANFIESLYRRQSTLRLVGELLLQRQSGFIQTGDYQFLKPLTRSTISKALDLHESTISRATMNKHVQLANGEIVPFEVFFKPALRIQKMIEGILSQESPDNPLSDEKVAALLAKKGVVVARRTVNKYRDNGRMLSSRRRKMA